MFLDWELQSIGRSWRRNFFRVDMGRRRANIRQWRWVAIYRFTVKKVLFVCLYYCQRVMPNKSIVPELRTFIICTDKVRRPRLSQNANCWGMEEPKAGRELLPVVRGGPDRQLSERVLGPA